MASSARSLINVKIKGERDCDVKKQNFKQCETLIFCGQWGGYKINSGIGTEFSSKAAAKCHPINITHQTTKRKQKVFSSRNHYF